MAGTVIYTRTDGSPDLAARSLLPVMAHFLKAAGVGLETIDISFAGRILQAFPEYLTAPQKRVDDMAQLARLVEKPDTVLIKSPNDSATTNLLMEAIPELQKAGFKIPDYPVNPANNKEKSIKQRYDTLTGSVVNPVLRKGNAVRSIPAPVKQAAKDNPHAMGEWKADSQTRVLHMPGDDFYATEQSSEITVAQAGKARLEFVNDKGRVQVLKNDLVFGAGDVIDAAVMRRAALRSFITDAITESRKTDTLLSLHLKATMMKKTDGAIFGDVMKAYFKPVFDKYAVLFSSLGVKPENGLGELLTKITALDAAKKAVIEADIQACLQNMAPLAMANMNTGQTHLDAPNTVIMDVSMANLARWGGQLQDAAGNYRDTLAVIPDSTYARMHQAGIKFLKAHGKPDPAVMGSVTTIRLQANGAEEYGSKDTTFEVPAKGKMRVVLQDGSVLHSHDVDAGDLWRLCRTENEAIENWAWIAADYAAKAKDPVIVWLDKDRPHDARIIEKLNHLNINDITILRPEEAMIVTLDRTMRGENTVAATGNLVGDHITDYFPIMEIASSSKMLSIIKLLNGGLVAETGSGGTAPDLLGHITARNHFLWDDVGTVLAVKESLDHLSAGVQNVKAKILAAGLGKATERYLADKRSPAPQGLDTRESHFYLTLYWAQEMAQQNDDTDLQQYFAPLAKKLEAASPAILAELAKDRGQAVTGMGGRYYPYPHVAEDLMRPSASLNAIIDPAAP